MSFLNKNYTKEALTLALPVMLTQVGQASVNLFDNIIVGQLLGPDALASVALGNAIFFAVFVLALGFSFAIPPLVSEANSKNDHKTINSVFSHGFVINVSVGFILMLLLLLGMPLLYKSGQPTKIIPDTIGFLTIMAISIVPFMAFQTLREVSEGLGHTINVTKATIIANVINIALNYVFIKGLWIFPEMGVKGSALAGLIARIFMVVFLYLVMLKDSKTKRYIKDFTLKISVFSKKMFEKIIRLGFPTAMQMFFEVTAFAGATFICGITFADDQISQQFASHQIASHQIALTMASFTFNLCIGFSVASTVMIGRKLGEQNFVELRKIGINNLKIAFLFMLFCGIVFIIGRDVLPGIFAENKEVEVLQLASKLMIIAALFQLSDGIQVTALGMLRGLQDVKIPSIITFIAYWLITIPLGYFLCVTLKMGAFGMWIALGLGLTISAFMLVKRFLNMSARRIKANKI